MRVRVRVLARAQARDVRGRGRGCERRQPNLLASHRTKFRHYLGDTDLVIRGGRVGSGACTAAYFVSLRRAARQDADLLAREGAPQELEREIVVAIRGTEDVHDMITDGLMQPVPLSASELGIGTTSPSEAAASSTAYGCAHLGVLLCARALVSELEPVLRELASEVAPRAAAPAALPRVWLCGHSLAGAVAALASLALQPALRGCAEVTALCYQPLPSLDAVAAD